MFRSLLFMPGNNPSMIQNADVFPSDAIIFDLEDSVDISEKDNARALMESYLSLGVSLPNIIVLRVNPIDTDFFVKDIELIKTKVVDYILLPKTSIDALCYLEQTLKEIEKENDLEPTKVIALVESSESIIDIYKIAKHKRIKAILLGAEDLCNDLEISRTNQGEEILFARSRVIYACAANNIISIDTPNTSVNDESLLKIDCINAKNLGMKAKSAIHPSQIETINKVFSPTEEEIHWANEVLESVKANEGKGAFSLDGKMVDKPIILKATKIIDKAKKFRII